MSFSYSFLLLSALILSFLNGSTSSLVIFMRTGPPLNPPSTLPQERLNQQWVLPSPSLPSPPKPSHLHLASGPQQEREKQPQELRPLREQLPVTVYLNQETLTAPLPAHPKLQRPSTKYPCSHESGDPSKALPLSWFPHFLFYASYQDLPALLAPS